MQAVVYAVGVTIWTWFTTIVVVASATAGVVGTTTVAEWIVPEKAHPVAYAVIWVILMLSVVVATVMTFMSLAFANKLKWQD